MSFTAQNIIFGYKFNKLTFTVPTPYLYDNGDGDVIPPIDYQGISRVNGSTATESIFTIPNHTLSVGEKFNAFAGGTNDEGQPFEITAINGDDVTVELIDENDTTLGNTNLDVRLWGRYFIVNSSLRPGIAADNIFFTINTNIDQKLTINWGDGNVSVINLTVGGNNLSRREHEYTDGLSEHTIILTFNDPSAITSIKTNRLQIGDVVPNEIVKFTNLQTINFGILSGIKQFPEDLSPLNQLENLAVESGDLTKIDQSIGQLPLKSLNFRGSLDFSQTETEESLAILLQLVELETLNLASTNLLKFPNDFVNRTKLKNLDIGKNSFTTIPQNIPTSIERLEIRDNSNLTSYQNFSRLVNLVEIRFASNVLFGLLNIPNDFSSLKKLKTYFDIRINSVSILDTTIDHWYDFIAVRQYGDITGASPQFRDMTFTIGDKNNNIIPTGTYQAPPNFDQGVSNGNPQSPFENVYALVHNFGHTWEINGTLYEN